MAALFFKSNPLFRTHSPLIRHVSRKTNIFSPRKLLFSVYFTPFTSIPLLCYNTTQRNSHFQIMVKRRAAMYSFQANTGRRKHKKTRRLLYIVIFILVIALVGVSLAYLRSTKVANTTSDALIARAISEASAAQNAVYRLTQSSGTNTTVLLASVRSHIYALQSINAIAANIYGAGTVLADADLLSSCISIIQQCETRMQAGSVLTDLFTQLRDQVDLIVAGFNGMV